MSSSAERPGGELGRIPRALLPVLATGAITALALLPGEISPTVAALAYVLAVMLSAPAGIWAGLAASLLAFLGLNFFFTPPRLTFSVAKSEDFVALLVFLVVSAVVGALISTALGQRARAERREREARLLHHLSGRLLSGEPPRAVLRSFAEAITDLLGLLRCEVSTDPDSSPLVVQPKGSIDTEGQAEEFSMTSGALEVGRITITSRAGLSQEEREVIRSFATQMALALERMRLADEARRAHVEAEESNLRAALFSSVSHDLRTPLASITAAVTSLQDEQTSFSDTDRSELLATIRHEAERLNRLVGNLMDLARIRAGALVPTKSPAAIEDVIEGVVARLQPMLSPHEILLRVREDIPDVPMDVLQIDQVLTNLLENAAKFSPPGSRITVAAAEWHDTLEVRVADTGPGIPPEQRSTAFDAFVRGKEPGSGTGLGLSIARAIVVAHGGQIRIEGTPGGGTTVIFHLPMGG